MNSDVCSVEKYVVFTVPCAVLVTLHGEVCSVADSVVCKAELSHCSMYYKVKCTVGTSMSVL